MSRERKERERKRSLGVCVCGEGGGGVGERQSEIDREPVLAQLAIFMQFYITSLVVKVRDHDFDGLRVCEPL